MGVDIWTCMQRLHRSFKWCRIRKEYVLTRMASIKVLVTIALILVIQFGINPVTGQGFNPNGGNTLSSRQTRQSGRSRSSALIDILLINSLAELDHDVEIEVPVYFNPSLTGSTSSGMIP